MRTSGATGPWACTKRPGAGCKRFDGGSEVRVAIERVVSRGVRHCWKWLDGDDSEMCESLPSRDLS